MKKLLFTLVALMCLSGPMQARATEALDYSVFARLPVQHEGRIKPIDSFARSFLTAFSGSSRIDNLAASGWLAELLFDPDQSYTREVFNVSNPGVRHSLDLPDRSNHHYTFTEIATAMEHHKSMVDSLLGAQAKDITDPAQQQVLVLYTYMLQYFEISRSLSLTLPMFEVDDRAIAEKIGVTAGQHFSYLEMIQHKATYLALVKPMLGRLGHDRPSEKQADLLRIGFMLQNMDADRQTQILRIVPPAWAQNRDVWLSPWAMLEAGQGSPRTAELLQSWQLMAQAYRNKDGVVWEKASKNALAQTLTLAGPQARPVALNAEYLYSLAHFFDISLGFYLATILTLLAGSKFYRLSFWLLGSGALSHLAGLLARIFIMERPPVGTLYESVIFVGLIVVVSGLILEIRNRHGPGLVIGALAGAILQMMGMAFAADGDTMGTLVAVLNTNFWLATHVVAITIGYGCCLVTGLLGHVYLLQSIINPSDSERLRATLRLMLSAALIALLFALTGTVLGGIWADQSWGRFWGWDPKENGALLIVLWLLSILHGWLSGLLRPVGFAMGSALTVVVVALSWFGVNLLNVGLHSYGFTTGIALNLGLFVAFEFILIGSGGLVLWQRKRSIA